MNYIPQKIAVIANRPGDADFAESTLSSYGFDVTRFESASQFTDKLREGQQDPSNNELQPPRLAVLAGSIEELAQGQAVSKILEVSPHLPLVATGSDATVNSAVNLMKQGAADVVDSPNDKEQLWERLRQAIDSINSPSNGSLLQQELQGRFEQLTQAEHDVLEAMLDGMANKQIAQHLSIGLRTVELRRSKIMKKMQAKNVAELVKLICLAGGIKE